MSKRRLYTLIILLVVALVMTAYTITSVVTAQKSLPPEFGFTFSKTYSEFLGLPWKESYIKILDELSFTTVRIPVYWNEVESVQGEYNFSDIRFQVEEAQKRGVTSVVVLGLRQPRWPECYIPGWAESLSLEDRNAELLKLIRASIIELQGFTAIIGWQVENEPFLTAFGECPVFTKDQLQQEINLVHELDTRLVIITASGELSTWIKESRVADIFGSTLYRVTGNKMFKSMQAYWFLRPSFYRIKALLVGMELKNYWIMELQAEPWVQGNLPDMTLNEQLKTMDIARLQTHIKFATEVGSPRVYLWGIEWWLYVKEKFGYDEMWNLFLKRD